LKRIYVNLKRFDVPAAYGGVNRLAEAREWGKRIVESTQGALSRYSASEAEFVMFFPEAHLISAAAAMSAGSPIKLGCQGLFREDTAAGSNFGAFTTNRPASIAHALGCLAVIIGHCEERKDKAGILAEAGLSDDSAVNRILNKEIKCAAARGLHVLYCIGETAEEQPRWREVLGAQLEEGLAGVAGGSIAVAYEPIWSVGPGKTPAGADYIAKVARFVKERTGGLEVVYGGGLKKDNARMLAGIPEVDGGLIALTRFSGEIGFYPDEYLDIVKAYLGA
jgi:triosephosphate isomerase (TIM)